MTHTLQVLECKRQAELEIVYGYYLTHDGTLVSIFLRSGNRWVGVIDRLRATRGKDKYIAWDADGKVVTERLGMETRQRLSLAAPFKSRRQLDLENISIIFNELNRLYAEMLFPESRPL